MKKHKDCTIIKSVRYKSYDGSYVIVLDVILNVDTNEDMVLYYVDNGTERLKVMALSSFTGKVEAEGKLVDKYSMNYRMPNNSLKKMIPLYDEYKNNKTYNEHYNDVPFSYLQKAKYILENYNENKRKLNLSIKSNKLVGLLKSDFDKIYENHKFLRDCLTTSLSEYKDIMLECFVNHKSIRKYAEEKGLNRGSVEYKRKKFIYEFAMLLEQRDLTSKTKN